MLAVNTEKDLLSLEVARLLDLDPLDANSIPEQFTTSALDKQYDSHQISYLRHDIPVDQKLSYIQVLGSESKDIYPFLREKSLPQLENITDAITDAEKRLSLSSILKKMDDATLKTLEKDLAGEGGEALRDLFREKPGCVKAWEILFIEGDDLSKILRKDPANLQKLDNFITTEGVDIGKLKTSFQNTKHPEVWLNLKKTQPELDEIYVAIKNDPPANLDPWTPEHKAQRWNNYKEGNGNLSYESWSNIYDGNIGKAVKGKQKVIDYALEVNIPVPPAKIEKSWPSDITINIRGQNITGKRRHDIFDEIENKAIEVKDYTTQNVSKSYDVEKEALMDIKIKESNPNLTIEWVFLGKGPSSSLRDLLINVNNG